MADVQVIELCVNLLRFRDEWLTQAAGESPRGARTSPLFSERKRKCWKTHFQLVKGEKFEFKGWRQMLRIVSYIRPVFTTKIQRKAFFGSFSFAC
jgi:hypothetical protein